MKEPSRDEIMIMNMFLAEFVQKHVKNGTDAKAFQHAAIRLSEVLQNEIEEMEPILITEYPFKTPTLDKE